MLKNHCLAAILCGALLAGYMPGAEAGNQGNDPVGTWLVQVSFPEASSGAPPAPPPFMEFLTFHAKGTLTETNSSLHANPVPFAPLNITGSTGFGAWERAEKGRVRFSFLKMVFCGPDFDATTDRATAELGCGIPGQQLGYLRVRAEATLRGDVYTGGESFVDLLVGPDPDAPFFTVKFGPAASAGKRIVVQAP
ncbi:hypothetical protein [Wenzhouxiangella sp. XN24]|uniref:hypothetical protein n=1 Tax=Wenzhouxiangella sp. XN24 TaxID=2713569 RepID=UPI0013EBF150|nr:hypothetical protein [Wenzhouxiangella sp. XN24]NGX17039.1 hypothetical protein [Wenzhouxiangella sp. XN24]